MVGSEVVGSAVVGSAVVGSAVVGDAVVGVGVGSSVVVTSPHAPQRALAHSEL